MIYIANGPGAGGGGGGDMVLASAQTNIGAKTFNNATLLMRNVADTFSAQFTNTNTAARTYTLQNRDGTLADDTDLALKANLASPTFTGTVVLPSGQALIAPALGTPASGIMTNVTGTASGLTAGSVTTNANLTGVVTSVGNATAIADAALSIAKTSGLQAAIDGKQATLTNSAGLLAALSDETGTGLAVFNNTPTLLTPVFTGLPTGSGVASAATASTLASRDANGNISADSILQGYTTTVTAAGTTTLTVNDTYLQFFTGSTTQTLTLPVASTLVLGQQFYIRNNSTGAVTINSSGANVVRIIAGNTRAIVTCILTSGTTAASWSAMYVGISITDGKILSASNTITLAGTDATTMTFPTTSATIARTDAAQSFTGVQTFVAPILGTPTSATLTNATGLPISGLVNSTSLALGVGSIELGHATDTTISRSAAGVIAVEGVVIPSISSTSTLTNKTITSYIDTGKRIVTLTDAATIATDAALGNILRVTLAGNRTLGVPTNPTDGQMVIYEFKQDATGTRTMTFTLTAGGFRGSTDVPLPTLTTTANAMDKVGFQYRSTPNFWECVAVSKGYAS